MQLEKDILIQYHQNIYNTYARLLAKNELLEEECLAKIEELEKEIANLNGTATVEGNEVLEG